MRPAALAIGTSRSRPAAMALPDLTADEGLKTALEKLDADFHGIMERKEVAARLQGELSNLG